ncbi:MAG: NADH-quinone oxidoreductase subunit N [Firmicutes bacterium]|nr:NADH-quinone oxidoreductase subunit N [Bacillota bacterium]
MPPTLIDITGQWQYLLAEMVLVGGGIVAMIVDLLLPRRNKSVVGYFSLAIVLAAITVVAVQMGRHVGGYLQFQYVGATGWKNTVVVDLFAQLMSLIMLVGALFVLVMDVYDWRGRQGYEGESYYLILFATTGALLMANSADLITLFIGMELLSLPSYVLAGLHRQNVKSNEAGLKYFLYGGLATAAILYGMSFLYGLSGTTDLVAMPSAIASQLPNERLFFDIAFAFLLLGLGFKMAVVPFHMWAPDVYEGAPTPVTAYLSVVSKVAGFAMATRVLIVPFLPVVAESTTAAHTGLPLVTILAIVAVLSMLGGNAAALRQRNAKRLFAYSSIAQAGYVLVGLAAMPGQSAATAGSMVFYLAVYALMNVGAFVTIEWVTRAAGDESLAAFAGLGRRSPWMAFAFTVCLLSLGGFPITAGFWGKFFLFSFAVNAQLSWLAYAGMVLSVISFVYYFRFIRQMYFVRPATAETLQVDAGNTVVLALCTVGVLFFGIVPNVLMGPAQAVGASFLSMLNAVP